MNILNKMPYKLVTFLIFIFLSLQLSASVINKKIVMVVSGYGQQQGAITPGYEFQLIDALVTNFHLSESTLLMLVSAFSGYDHIMPAYQHAIDNEYRFFSYGDAMFLTKQALDKS